MMGLPRSSSRVESWMSRTRRSVLPRMLGLALLAVVALPRCASAQIPPTVLPFIDLKCYGLTDPDGNPLPPLLFQLVADHLNPLFVRLQLPRENVVMLDPVQLCVPVAKNGMNPPPDALKFIQYIDLKCYNVQADPPGLPNLPLVLLHQNPVLRQTLPPEQVVVQNAQKLCVPVAKANPDGSPALPPPDVLPSVQFIDQKCYAIVGPDGGPLPPVNFPLHLDHLNPVLTPDIAPPEDVAMQDPQQFCAPVKKNGQVPPDPQILRVIEQIDLKCYGLTDQDGNPLDPLGLPQTLFHLNPVLRNQDPEKVLIQEPQQLCVPVSKQQQGGGRAATTIGAFVQ